MRSTARFFAALLTVSFLLIMQSGAAQALPSRVKVELFSSRKVATGTSEAMGLLGPVQILEPCVLGLGEGRYSIELAGDGLCISRPTLYSRSKPLISGAPRIVLAPVKSTIQIPDPGDYRKPRSYRGTVTITRGAGNKLLIINDVDTRSYITSCVGSESLPSFRPEALKAQAVLSTTLLERSYRGKPIPDSTEEQSYLGATSERADVKAAVDSVFGQELFYAGRPIDVFFCSTCGGTTARPDIFGGQVQEGRYPYLKEITCNYCKGSPFYKDLVKEIGAAEFLKKAGCVLPRVEVERLGRPSQVSVTKAGHKSSMDGYQFWLLLGKSFGWGFVPSTRYSIELAPDVIKFVSRGCGHGVGLCQWGADGQARAGRGYKEILSFYFPGTTLKTPSR